MLGGHEAAVWASGDDEYRAQFQKGLSTDHMPRVSAQPPAGLSLKRPCRHAAVLPTPLMRHDSQVSGDECAFN